MSKKLKFLADESLEYSIVLWLREQDFDVISIAEDFPSIEDEKVLEKAAQMYLETLESSPKLQDNYKKCMKDIKLKKLRI